MLKVIDLEGVIFGHMCPSYPLLFMLFVFFNTLNFFRFVLKCIHDSLFMSDAPNT